MDTKLAILFEADAFDRKGLFNAVQGRAAALRDRGGYEIGLYCIQCRDSLLSRRLRHTAKSDPSVREVDLDGMRCTLLWYRFSFLDWFLTEKLHRRPLLFNRFVRRCVPVLRGYDLVSAHSFTAGMVASSSGVPFCVTWHGSDIHTIPFRNPLIRRDTAFLMEKAEKNFFVSGALMDRSAEIGRARGAMVLHNGVDARFHRLGAEERLESRRRWDVDPGTAVVAFAGSVFKVKNVGILPALFHEVRRLYGGALLFMVIGDGKAMPQLRPPVEADPTLECRFMGNRSPEEMPSLLGTVDVLVLPSLNEGLPLVPMEAMLCGARVIGSEVGGIPEVIGRGNCVPLGEGFVEKMARKVVDAISAPAPQIPEGGFGWERTAALESKAYEDVRAER